MDVRRGMVVTTMIGMLVALTGSRDAAAKIAPLPEAGRRVVNSNGDWRFAKGQQTGAEKSEFDDAAWQAVRLPHDWAISGPFNASENGYAGKLPWRGEGWYRKTFTLDEALGFRPEAVGASPASDTQPKASSLQPLAASTSISMV